MIDEEKAKEQLMIELTEYRKAESFLSAQAQILELITKDISLFELLTFLIQVIEEQEQGFMCSILLKRGTRLYHGAAPSLPEEFNREFDNLVLGDRSGSCGAAASCQKPVFTYNISTDPLWKKYKGLTLKYSLKACWSVPVFSSTGDVLGTFAMYYNKPCKPEAKHFKLLDFGTRLAGIAIERKKIAETLETSKQRFRCAFDHANIGMALSAPNGLFLEVNPSLCEIVGYSEQELLTMSFHDITQPDDLEDSKLKIKQLFSGEVTYYKKEKRYIHKKGHFVWVSISVSLVRDSYNKPLYFVAHMQDITKRRQTEEELKKYRNHLEELVKERTKELAITNQQLKYQISERMQTEKALVESEEKFKELFQNAKDAIFLNELTDEGVMGRFIEVNQMACESLGYSRNELINMYPQDIVIEEHLGDVSEVIQNLKNQDSITFETIHLTKDGAEVPVEINSHLFLSNGKKVVLSVARDITERKNAEKKLIESEERYRLLVEHSPNAIFIHVDKKIVFANNACADMVGAANSEQLIGMPVMKLVHQDYKHVAEMRAEKAISGEMQTFAEYKAIKLDGTVIEIEVFTIPFNYQGKPAVQVVCQDITDRKRIEEEHQKMQKLESIGLLAGGIAHDFNNILTVIQGNISLAKMYQDDKERTANKLEEVVKAVEQAKYLTNQLLTFSKGGDPVKKVININELIEDTINLVLSGSNVKARLSVDDNLLPVEVDEGQINQVINNIVINSCQAMPEGGTISIRVENFYGEFESNLPLVKKGDYIKIVITDEGIGIPEKYLPKLFDPYFTTKQEGSGLGLATSYSIVKKHDGHITVNSEIGVGTTFNIYLPAAENRESLMRKSEERKVHSGKGKVLVMDDEKTIRELLGEMLSYLGYQVEFSIDGEEAVTLYKEARKNGKKFEFVIMDLTIPGGMGGKQTIKVLREFDPEVKAVVSSGYSNDDVMANFKDYGFKGAVAKPYEIDELSRVIDSVLVDTHIEAK